jgi:serine/threonine-protein kinase
MDKADILQPVDQWTMKKQGRGDLSLMSDFLSQFSEKEYNKAEHARTESGGSGGIPPSREHGARPSLEGARTSRVGITAPEHDTEIDNEYNRRKLIRYGIVAGTVIAVAVLIYLMVSLLNQVTVKNFVGTSINDAKTWGITSKISIETETVFNNEYDNTFIITQSQDPGKKIRKGSVLTFQVSQGPDPDERIELPDFAAMNTTQVYAWKDQNKANSANIMQENSETIAANQFIRQEFSNPSVTADTYTRKDGLLIYMSKGPFEANITVPDFTEKAKAEAEAWVQQNKLEALYTEQPSDKVPQGFIISQDPEPGVKIAQSTPITFIVSTGKAAIVPNFSRMTQEEAMAQEDLSVTVRTQYSGTVAYGRLISHSVPAGRQLSAEPARVTVVYSEGRPYIDDLVGMSEKELPAYFYEFTGKGAAITHSVVYVDSSEPKGQVVWASLYSQFVEMNAHVEIRVSKGNL